MDKDRKQFEAGRRRKVLNRVLKNLIGLAAIAAFATSIWAQAPAAAKAPAWKDQGEYDIAQSIGKAADPQKKLELVKQWEQKYPESDMKATRTFYKISAESAIALKALQPGASPAELEAAQNAAQDLIDNLDTYFAPDDKPAQATAEQWKQAKSQTAVQAHFVLGTVAISKKTPAGDAIAETQFKKVLELQPNMASASYQLGTTILHEKDVNRVPEALYDIAHAMDVMGPTALDAAGKTAREDFLKKAYDGYHGDDKGLDDLMKAAAASPTEPAGFTIKSVVDIQKEQEGDAAAFAAANPDIALWRTIRAALTADGGAAYFDQIKGSEIPPQSDDAKFKMFRAKVISQPSAKELLVNVDSAAGDATLQFETAIKGTIDPGTAMSFKGVVDSFTKDPAYMLTFSGMGKEDVDGLPATAFAAAPARRPRAPARKK